MEMTQFDPRNTPYIRTPVLLPPDMRGPNPIEVKLQDNNKLMKKTSEMRHVVASEMEIKRTWK
jgi:hypothetical protein